jgi:hypothetical protein
MDGDRLAPCGVDLLADRSCGFGLGVEVYRYVGTGAGQGESDGFAYASACAGYQGCAAGELGHY